MGIDSFSVGEYRQKCEEDTEYIQNQLREDRIADQMTEKESVDRFVGSRQQALASDKPHQLKRS